MMQIAKGALFLCVIAVIALFFLARRAPAREITALGATFAPFHAEALGLDPQAVYHALLDDLGIRKIRISAYWNRIEKTRGEFDFSELDWQVSEAEKRDAELVLAVGQKLPRWPECHIPEWAASLSPPEYQEELLQYIVVVVNRYKNSPAVKIWQIENEPFLNFGICPPFSPETLDAEIKLARELDSPASPTSLGGRPIMITDSGEISLWIQAHRRADVFGTTLYRTIWHPSVGAFTYPLPPVFFRVKRAITDLINGSKPTLVIELQAEPWQERMLYETELEEQYKTMNPESFRTLLSYIRKTGFDEFYFWGVEWWYWLKEKHAMPEMWDIAREAIQATKQ